MNTAAQILQKHEDANEMHLHHVDRKWVIEAMEEYAEQQVQAVVKYYNGESTKEYAKEKSEISIIPEISDVEIEKYINSFPYTEHLDDGQYNDGVITGLELGIEWYKEQLKHKL